MAKHRTNRSRLSRELLLPLLAAHVLENGLSNASLRPLAKAAGTSDRMLIYHFGSKEQLIADLLDFLAQRFADNLQLAFSGPPEASRAETVRKVLKVTQAPGMAPFLRLWWQIVAEAACGNLAYLDSAQSIMGTLLSWLQDNMPTDDPDPEGGARLLLTFIEGSQMLSAVGRADITEQAVAAFGASGLAR